MGDLIALGTPPLLIVLRSAAVYVAIFILLRLTGKRQLGQFTPFDFTVLLLVANAVQNAMIGPDTSLLGGLLGAVTLLGTNYAVSAVADRNTRLAGQLIGHPTLLVDNGHLITAHLRKERIDPDEVLMAMREHGVEDIAKVRHAILETDGTISIVTNDTPITRTQRRVRGHGHGRTPL